MATQTIFNWAGTTSYTLPNGEITGPNLARPGVTSQGNTSLNLISQNAPDYTSPINSNFIWLLENFAGGTTPANAIPGQLWYDTSSSSNPQLKIYNPGLSTFQTITGVAAGLSVGSNVGVIQFNNGSGNLSADTDFRWFTANNTLATENVNVNNNATVVNTVYVGNVSSSNAFVILNGAGDLTVGNAAAFLGNVTINAQMQSNTLNIISTANLGADLNLTGYANLNGNVKAKGTTGQFQINSNGNVAGSANLTFSGGILNIDGDANVDGNLTVGGSIIGSSSDVSGINTLTAYEVTANLITTTSAPSGSEGDGVNGQIAYDSDFIYICVGVNYWKRVALIDF